VCVYIYIYIYINCSYKYISYILSLQLRLLQVLLVVGISTSVIIFLISYFWSWSFCRNFICFQFHLSIQINGNMFFNSALIILIFNFFSCPFVKLLFFSILLFNQNIVFIFMIILTLILLIFLVLLLIFFLFNFTLQSSLKFILCFNFNLHYFNCNFFNSFI